MQRVGQTHDPKGANNWNSELHGACFGGHKELINLMISRKSM
jgi:hypothetical protein